MWRVVRGPARLRRLGGHPLARADGHGPDAGAEAVQDGQRRVLGRVRHRPCLCGHNSMVRHLGEWRLGLKAYLSRLPQISRNLISQQPPGTAYVVPQRCPEPRVGLSSLRRDRPDRDPDHLGDLGLRRRPQRPRARSSARSAIKADRRGARGHLGCLLPELGGAAARRQGRARLTELPRLSPSDPPPTG